MGKPGLSASSPHGSRNELSRRSTDERTVNKNAAAIPSGGDSTANQVAIGCCILVA